VRKIYVNEGLKGLFKGFIVTNVRDIPQWAAFFTAIEQFKKFYLKNTGRKDFYPHESLMAGSFAGFSCWIISYPLDTVKTKI